MAEEEAGEEVAATLRGCGVSVGCGLLSVPPQPSAGAEEEELPSAGAQPAAQGEASDPDPEEKKTAPGHPLKPPAAAPVRVKNLPSPRAARKHSYKSPTARKSSRGASPKRLSPWRSSPSRKDQTLTSFSLSPSPQAKRRSWRRSSLKGSKRRKSLPPVHQEVTELSKSINKDLPETERLSMLLLASFQFSARKLEHSLQHSNSFSPEPFRAKVHSLAEDLTTYLQKLTQDGTLKACVEDPDGVLDPAVQKSVAQVKEHIARFTTECQAWDQLLQRYQEGAEDISRQLEECKRKEGRTEPQDYLQTSQAEVLNSKPNYQQILDEQGEVLSFMQLVLEELQQAVKLLQAFSHDSHQFLRGLSEQLAARSFRQLERSPMRKLLGALPRKKPPPEG